MSLGSLGGTCTVGNSLLVVVREEITHKREPGTTKAANQ
jgi:hypothetical protein